MQLFIIGFTMLTKRSAETLTALSSFLDIPNWADNYSFPVPHKNKNYDSGIRCSDRDRLVSIVISAFSLLRMYLKYGTVCRWRTMNPSTRSSPGSLTPE